MEPVKSFYALSTWTLRIALLVLVYMIFFTTLMSPNFHSIDFYVAAGFTLFAVLLFIGGFMNKHGMTVISSLFLMLGCVYKIVMHYVFHKGSFVAIFFVLGAISMFFFANGNRKK